MPPLGFSSLWPAIFQDALLAVAVFLAAGSGLGVLGAEGVGDALVGGVGLTVDAVGVDLEQDRDAVPGAADDLGRGTPEFSHSDTAACRRSYGRRGRPGGGLAVSVRAHALGQLVVVVGISTDGQMADHDVIPRKVAMIAWLSRWSRR